MIPVFIASSERFKEIEWLTLQSIHDNTSEQVDVHVVRPQWYGMKEGGCTGFTHVRWAIPQICREYGYTFGIYLDVDMVVLSDIKELWDYRQRGKWVCLEDGSNEVSVICATLQYPDKSVLHNRHKGTLPRGDHLPKIPLEWNCEDRLTPGAKILHFTDLKTQPWFYDHPDTEAVGVYEDICARHHRRNRPESNDSDHRAA